MSLVRSLIILLASLLLVQQASAESGRPNFIVILCDDLGYGDLGCFGHPHIKTPHLDKLAKDGIRFTSFYSAAPVCSPSRVGLLTGRNPNFAGVYDWIPHVEQKNQAGQQSRHLVHMRREEVTLPQILKSAGYATAMAGKWHCNAIFNNKAQPQPGDAGFDHWLATQNNAAPSHENPVNYVRNGKELGPLKGFSCQIAADEASGWIEKHVSAKYDRPFFVYLAFHEPHEPVASPADLVASYKDVARNEDEAQYFANVENMDRAVGTVLDKLDTLKIADNTVIVFSSDNGPETLNRYPASKRSYGQPGPLRGMKLWTTDAGFRVPGIVRWPAALKGGQTLNEPISSMDLLPSFAALGEATVPADLILDGMDISPLMKGEALPERKKPLLWAYFNAINEQRVALRHGEWKILAKLNHGKTPKITNVTVENLPKVKDAVLTDFSLYKVSEDIHEDTDLSTAEPEIFSGMKREIEAAYQDMLARMHVWPAQPLSDQAHE